MRPIVLIAALTLCGAAIAGAAPVPAGSGWIEFTIRDFVIAHPPDWRVDPHHTHDLSPPIHGVSFTVAPELVTGTNLGGDTALSVERVEGQCSASRFLDQPEDEHMASDAGRNYSVATAGDAGAGNRYEETVYALAHGKTCFGIRYFIHYAAIENFDPGSVRAFDRTALAAIFDRMRRSLEFVN